MGRVLGEKALAAVGSSYTLMTFLTSILLGLCIGSSVYFSIQFGKKDYDRLNRGIYLSFLLIGALTILLNTFAFLKVDWIIWVLQIPVEMKGLMKEYLVWIFAGIVATFLYNYFANLLRAVGNSVVPLLFLGVSVTLNILLDIFFVVVCRWGVKGAAVATVIAQFISGIGIMIYYYFGFPLLRIKRQHMKWDSSILKDIFGLSVFLNLSSTVCNEFWNFDGTGAGKQFWNGSDGGICSGSKD